MLSHSNLYAQISDVINSYARVNTLTGNQLVVQDISLAPGVTIDEAFGVGQKILVIQMKGAQIDISNTASFGSLVSLGNTGNYEFATITSSTGSMTNRVIRVAGLTRTYDLSSLQIVSIPQYTDVTITGDITAQPWNGSVGTGGVVVLEVSDSLTLHADINVNGQGFAGGATNSSQRTSCNNRDTYVSGVMDYGIDAGGQNHAQKGESIVDYADNGISGMEYGRGAILTGGGGGNSHNGGGGGGGNYTPGGDGGWGWLSSGACTGGFNSSAGMGSYTMAYSIATNKIFLGGGGGGGQQNNSHGSGGGNGGGIIIVRANTLVVPDDSSPTGFYANGADAPNSTGNDSAGGGGGGGVIVLDIMNYSLDETLIARSDGGNGGHTMNSAPHAGGGGGGVGVMLLNSAPPTDSDFSSTPGAPGNDCNGSCTRVSGSSGGSTGIPYLIDWSVSGELDPLPIELKTFTTKLIEDQVLIQWVTILEDNTDFFEIERSTDLINLESIGQIKANGNSNSELSYQLWDRNPLSGVSYYRLKSVDFDRTVSYSSWKSILYSPDNNLAISVFPNPSSEVVNFQVSDTKEKQHLFIFDTKGQMIHESTFQNSYSYKVDQLSKGSYFLKVSSSNGIIESSFLIQ